MLSLQKFAQKHKKHLQTLYYFAILILFSLCMALLLLPGKVEGEAYFAPVTTVRPQKASLPTQEVKAPQIAIPDVWRGTGKEIEIQIRSIAVEVGLKDVERALAIGRCESGLNPNSVGDHGYSYGLWQIHLPSHPDISKQQALDPDWSTRWALNRMKQGSWSLWTCNKLI